MAFNFNWSPLTADEEFYQRARDLLTAALNKSPKPPIIVDDILVTEFNLGSVPPDLEILEIGDLAEDRFRGIFKMCYSGDAYLTLRTRVQGSLQGSLPISLRRTLMKRLEDMMADGTNEQANPLNTYLSAKPCFTSPQPLAAAAGLTIPLSITLSEIKLSAFVILVFSKQKGLTLVFRNDPLESIKVSSTFDSIQFVRDYLQRTIEGQLRNLMMEELPTIIHKLSLRLWCPGQLAATDYEAGDGCDDEIAIDPFATPPFDVLGSGEHVLDASEISSYSLESATQIHPLFSQKNLSCLMALDERHRTLSLYTPGIQHVTYRSWWTPMERLEAGRSTPHTTHSLMRAQSVQGNSTTYTFTDVGNTESGQLPSRSSFANLNSATTGLGLTSGRNPRMRKKKTRVVNLRRTKTGIASETTSETGDTISETTSIAGPSSEPLLPHVIVEDPEAEDVQTPVGTASRTRFEGGIEKASSSRPPLNLDIFRNPAATAGEHQNPADKDAASTLQQKHLEVAALAAKRQYNAERKRPNGSDTSSVILEQAWISKMAGEIARRVYDEKQRNANFWANRDEIPPPAYEATPR